MSDLEKNSDFFAVFSSSVDSARRSMAISVTPSDRRFSRMDALSACPDPNRSNHSVAEMSPSASPSPAWLPSTSPHATMYAASARRSSSSLCPFGPCACRSAFTSSSSEMVPLPSESSRSNAWLATMDCTANRAYSRSYCTSCSPNSLYTRLFVPSALYATKRIRMLEKLSSRNACTNVSRIKAASRREMTPPELTLTRTPFCERSTYALEPSGRLAR